MASRAQRSHSAEAGERKVLEQRGTETPATGSIMETRFLQFLRPYMLPPPDRQVRIHDDDGFAARVDFYFHTGASLWRSKSRRHHSSRADWERDLRRRNALTAHNLRVLHVTHRRMTHDPECLASELRKLLCGPA
jgi:hypothetical protein